MASRRAQKEPGPLAETAPADAKPKRRRWGRFLFRAAARLVVLAVLLLAALAVLAAFYPVSLPWIDTQIQRYWLQATGTALSYDRATFRLSRGEVTIARPRLSDPAGGQSLLELERLQVDVPVAQFFSKPQAYQIDHIQMTGPVLLTMAVREGRIEPVGPVGRLWQIVQERTAYLGQTAGGLGGVEFGLVRLAPINLRMVEDREDGQRTLLGLDSIQMDLDFQGGSRPQIVFIRGQFNGQPPQSVPRPFELAIRPEWSTAAANLSFNLSEFDSTRDLPWPFLVALSGGRMETRAHLAWEGGGRWHLTGNASIEECLIGKAGGSSPAKIGMVRLGGDFLWDSRTDQLDVQSASLDSTACRLLANGSVSTASPNAYRLSVQRLELGGPSLAGVASEWIDTENLLQPELVRLTLMGDVAGELANPRPSSILGTMLIDGVDWRVASLPAPLRQVRGQVELTTGTLQVKTIAGTLAGIPIELNGVVHGEPMAGRIDSVDVRWHTSGDLQGLAKLLPKFGRSKNSIAIEGKFQGQGRLSVSQPLSGNLLNALNRSSFEGYLQLREGRLSHPSLMHPIEGLQGRIDFTPVKAILTNVVAASSAGTLRLDGEISGSPRFWDSPRLMGRVRLDADVADLLRELRDNRVPGTEGLDSLPPVTGRLHVQSGLRGDLSQWDQMQYETSVELNDVVTSLSLPAINGDLRMTRLQATVGPDRLQVDDVRGTLGTLKLSARGELRPSGGGMDLNVDGELAELKRRLPKALAWFEVGGQAHVNHRIDLSLDSSMKAPADWLGWWRWIRERNTQPGQAGKALQDVWKISHTGVVQLHEAELTEISMPTRLLGVSGMVRYDNRHLWTPEPVAAFSVEGDRNLKLALDLSPREDGTNYILNLGVTGDHLVLDPWIRNWRRPPGYKPRTWAPDLVFNSELTPEFELQLKMETSSAEWMHLQSHNFSGRLNYRDYAEQPDWLQWEELRGELYGGRMEVGGSLLLWKINTSVKLTDVDLPPLVLALNPREQTNGIFSGRLTGWMDLTERLKDPEEPWRGRGYIDIQKSRFIANGIFNAMGGLLKLPLFDDISFSRINGDFEVANGVVTTPGGITFENPLMNLRMTGSIGPALGLNLIMKAEFLQIARGVPLVGEALNLFSRLAGQAVVFRIQGVLDNPSVTPMPGPLSNL